MKKIAKIVAVFLVTAVALVALSVNAMTEPERQALIKQLQQQIAELTVQLYQIQNRNTATSQQNWNYTFTSNLARGSSGAEVSALQTALVRRGYEISDSPGVYGSSTAAAVKQFQEDEIPQVLISLGLKAGTGTVAGATRNALNAIYSKETSSGSQVATGSSGSASAVRPITPGSSVISGSSQTSSVGSTKWPTVGTATNSSVTSSTNSSNNSSANSSTNSSSAKCVSNCTCGSWSSCENGIKTRSCNDANNCGNAICPLVETSSCSTTCIPKTCSSFGVKCGTVDNGCGGTLNCTCGFGYSCQAGTCVVDSGTSQCTVDRFDTCQDGNKNNTTGNYYYVSKCYSDGRTYKKYSCESGRCVSKEYSCANGCSNNHCAAPLTLRTCRMPDSNTCITNQQNSAVEATKVRHCKDSNTLISYSCGVSSIVGTTCLAHEANCPAGCENAACKVPESSKNPLPIIPF